LSEYPKRLQKNLKSAVLLNYGRGSAQFVRGDAQNIALLDNTVDLIVTSPPYAANAIDYMRAHKFSLIWLGHTLKNLSDLRSQYIGHDALAGFEMHSLPDFVADIVETVRRLDPKKGGILQRYYSEATLFLREMLRVLKPGRAAIVVVGPSTMRNVDTQTGQCLAEIGKSLGFTAVEIGVRKLDRDKRMMPARRKLTEDSTQIEERMHEEYVIALMKPIGETESHEL
jgi:DNA modification methylase